MNNRRIHVSVYELFIIGTGAFAFLHSTWAIATFFAGVEPDRVQNGLQWILWVAEGSIFAACMDIGMIVTAMLIRAGKSSKGYKATFAFLALATYLTQFLYIITHIPLVQVSAGVADQYQAISKFVRDATIFVLPALLPLSTTLYTFSHGKEIARATTNSKQSAAPAKWVVEDTPPSVTALPAPANVNMQNVDIGCNECDWKGAGYKSIDSANRALRAHKQHQHKVEVE